MNPTKYFTGFIPILFISDHEAASIMPIVKESASDGELSLENHQKIVGFLTKAQLEFLNEDQELKDSNGGDSQKNVEDQLIDLLKSKI